MRNCRFPVLLLAAFHLDRLFRVSYRFQNHEMRLRTVILYDSWTLRYVRAQYSHKYISYFQSAADCKKRAFTFRRIVLDVEPPTTVRNESTGVGLSQDILSVVFATLLLRSCRPYQRSLSHAAARKTTTFSHWSHVRPCVVLCNVLKNKREMPVFTEFRKALRRSSFTRTRVRANS